MNSRKSFFASCRIVTTALLLFLLPKFSFAQTPDAVDVLHYDLELDVGNAQAQTLQGTATLTVRLVQACDSIELMLKPSIINAVWVNGVADTGYFYSAENLHIPLRDVAVGDTFTIAIAYSKRAYVESYGWGGLHFDNNIYYNLGVAFKEDPHNFGRAMFPCRDNFYDKATYRMTITAQPGWQALCSGLCDTAFLNADQSHTSVWVLDKNVSTYLVSMSVAPWRIQQGSVAGLYSTYPVTLGYFSDSVGVANAYAELDSVVPMYERCFGPYRWDRIGYIATPKGSMEHVSNIGLVNQCMNSMDLSCQSVIAHELSHSWFGNLVTCATSGDMWFNEGGASFCEEVAREAMAGKEAATTYYQEMLEEVLRTAHIDDGGYVPLYGVPSELTYGSTVYHKGAMVWHSLRSVLGDSLFYATMQRFFREQAFDTIGSHRLCELLSDYSGVDLRAFFDFHVFDAGFVDYEPQLVYSAQESDTWWTQFRIRQQTVAAERSLCHGKIPVTFFSASREQYKQWFEVDDADQLLWAGVPFEPVFAIVDYDHELSDAVIDDAVQPTYSGNKSLPLAHAMLRTISADPNYYVHVAHHFAKPFDCDTIEGIVRTANRYWVVDGIFPESCQSLGYFEFSRQGNNGDCPNLDAGFYSRTTSLDSIRLLWRPDASSRWQVISDHRNGNTLSGYFIADQLRRGEYTLAVIDSNFRNIVGVAKVDSDKQSLRVCPNPAKDSFNVYFNDFGQDATLSLTDLMGREVLRREGVRNGDVLSVKLPSGNYIVTIKNNFLSLQSKIIVL